MCAFSKHSPSNSKGNEGVWHVSRFIPPLFSGHPTLWSLSALICSIVLIIWGDQLRPPPPSTWARCRWPFSLKEYLLRSSVTYECGTELSQSLGLSRETKFQMGELIQKIIEILECTMSQVLLWQLYNSLRRPEKVAKWTTLLNEMAHNPVFEHYYQQQQRITLRVARAGFSARDLNAVATLKPQWKRWWKRKGNPSCIYLLRANTLPMHQQGMCPNWQAVSWHIDIIFLLGPRRLSQLLLAVVIRPGVPVRRGSGKIYVNQSENVARLQTRSAPTSWCPPPLLSSRWGNANKSLPNFCPAVNQLITFPLLCWAAEYIINSFEIFEAFYSIL